MSGQKVHAKSKRDLHLQTPNPSARAHNSRIAQLNFHWSRIVKIGRKQPYVATKETMQIILCAKEKDKQ